MSSSSPPPTSSSAPRNNNATPPSSAAALATSSMLTSSTGPTGHVRTPHYSLVTDPVETVNPVTGRSLYYGARPWRCDDRLQDFTTTLFKLRSFSNIRETLSVFVKCARSDFGEQPTVPYVALQRQEVMFYLDRHDNGMIRDYCFERYPYNTRDVGRVQTEGGTRMRVWRHQRELELEAKRGRVEELLSSQALPTSSSSSSPSSSAPPNGKTTSRST